MNNDQKRLVLFLGGCMTSRFFVTWLASRATSIHLQMMGAVAMFIAAGFTYIWLTNSRKTGAEVFGAPIWWNSLRPIHALLWGAFAVLALFEVRWAWMILLFDTLFGLGAFTVHRLRPSII
jgi:hypothetical protein